jgi:hypothetical protein
MVGKPSQTERLAALLAAVPGVCLGTDLPERPARSPGSIQEPAPQDCDGCVSGGTVDTLDLDTKRPLQGKPEGLRGA